MSNNLTFQGTSLRTITKNNQKYVRGTDIARALGYKDKSQVAKLYRAYKDEFEPGMSLTKVESTLVGKGKCNVNYFNRRGAWLIGMFARTTKAKDFRKWVLNVLEEKTAPKAQPSFSNELTETIDALFLAIDRIDEVSTVDMRQIAGRKLIKRLLSEAREKCHSMAIKAHTALNPRIAKLFAH